MSRADTTPDDSTSVGDPIVSFYERHPYPPPVDDLDDYRVRWSDPTVRRAEHHLLFPGHSFQEDLQVLVAGCGTFQAARHAMRWPGGRVVGIDVSDTSIRHTQALKQRYELANLELHQMPIERVGELDRQFDLIVCTGVLHHLVDPDAGLRALRSVLRSGGAMLIMVYAPYGRTGVTMMQEYARRLEIGTSQEEIGDLARSLVEIPRDHPLDSLLRNSPDFRKSDALADALLNPRDRTYSVPEFFDYIERSGFVFGRWYRQAPYRAECGALLTIPHASRLAALPPAEQYAAVELFRGSMSRHSAVIHRDDDPLDRWQYEPDNTVLTEAIPIRLPQTLTIEERLPPGAAAVLINRSHPYPDLVVPIDHLEKRLIDAIDGRRSITEIAAGAGLGGEGDRGRVLGFFRQLLRCDQVVLDLSGTAPNDG
ncbi:MAG: class I SAM-dependent methyltransferase [Actinomycetota bacterium]|nr:class I SAM-dependent methyltransferase [Actinomycetota bacterium]